MVSTSKPGKRIHSSSSPIIANARNNAHKSTTQLSLSKDNSQEQSLVNVNTMMFVFYTTVGATLPYLPMYYKSIELTGMFT